MAPIVRKWHSIHAAVVGLVCALFLVLPQAQAQQPGAPWHTPQGASRPIPAASAVQDRPVDTPPGKGGAVGTHARPAATLPPLVWQSPWPAAAPEAAPNNWWEIDLSTRAGSAWRVDGLSVVGVRQVPPGWSQGNGWAQWVTANPLGEWALPARTYEYRVAVQIPRCEVAHQLWLTGEVSAEQSVQLFWHDRPVPLTPLMPPVWAPPASCTVWGGCSQGRQPGVLHASWLAASNTPAYAQWLVARVRGTGGGSGLYVDARISSSCPPALTHVR